MTAATDKPSGPSLGNPVVANINALRMQVAALDTLLLEVQGELKVAYRHLAVMQEFNRQREERMVAAVESVAGAMEALRATLADEHQKDREAFTREQVVDRAAFHLQLAGEVEHRHTQIDDVLTGCDVAMRRMAAELRGLREKVDTLEPEPTLIPLREREVA